jgi:uncharacterized membrane protein
MMSCLTSYPKHFLRYGVDHKRTKLKIMNKTLGLILTILGIVMLVWTGFSYTKKEKVVDAGPIEISADKEKSVNWPPYVGGVVLIAGVVILITSKKK